MNCSPSPYLKVTRLALIQRGTSKTSSCSTLTTSMGPIPSGNSNVSCSEKGSVVNQPLSFSQITGGFKHSSIVVQMEKLGANSYPSIVIFVPSRMPISSISSNKIGRAHV